MTEWIKCSEKMPGIGQEVIVFDKEARKVQSGVMREDGHRPEWGNVFVDFNDESYLVTNVELWQPLPPPPAD